MFQNEVNQNKKVPLWLKIVFGILGVLLLILIIAGFLIRNKWTRAEYLTSEMFQSNAQNEIPVVKANPLNDEGTEEIEGTISYNGKRYKYNDNLINILVLGIDDRETVDKESGIISPSQADSIVLLTIDAVKKEASFLNVPRDSVTQVKVLDGYDNYVTSQYAPVAVQHSFGSQGEVTNETTVNTVSNLLYGIPTYRYVVVNMSAVPVVNDAVGGVTVTCLEDLTKWDANMKEGQELHLEGDEALTYVQRRDVNIEDSPMGRLNRQIQYIKALFPLVKERTKSNIMFPLNIYNQLSDRITTDLTTDEIMYLARQLTEIELGEDTVATVPGVYRAIEEGEYENYEYPNGYVVDEEALKQMIIDRFYIEADTLH